MEYFIADTDVLLEFLNGDGSLNEVIRQKLRERTLATTSVNVLELYARVTTPEQKRTIQSFLRAVHVVSINSEMAVLASEICKKKLRPALSVSEALIAGACMYQKAVLVTKNSTKYENLGAVKVFKSKTKNKKRVPESA